MSSDESGFRTMSAHAGPHRVFRKLVWPHPRVFLGLARLGVIPNLPAAYLSADFDLSIAGFPRSGNTFVLALLRTTQGEGLKIASHSHSVPLIKHLIGAGVPTCFLIRRPADAVLSWAICQGCPVGEALEFYIFFHRKLLGLRDAMVVCPFEIAVSDFGIALRGLIGRGAVGLRLDFDQAALRDRVFERVEREDRAQGKGEAMVARPSEERRETKSRLAAELETPRNARKMERAKALYRCFVSD